ncbi:MAG: hypothetical protein ACK4R7_00205 [Fervidobacterium sp.]
MGELPSDVRVILEYLARGEITVDDAEKLILTIKRPENVRFSDSTNNTVGKRSIIGREFTLAEDGECLEDLELVNSKVVIKGKVYGNLELIFCDVYFSGEVQGDLKAIGCKVTWDGGKIGGYLELVGCTYTGKKPLVSGNVNEINNFFVNGILQSVRLFVKPILSGIKIDERKDQ